MPSANELRPDEADAADVPGTTAPFAHRGAMVPDQPSKVSAGKPRPAPRATKRAPDSGCAVRSVACLDVVA